MRRGAKPNRLQIENRISATEILAASYSAYIAAERGSTVGVAPKHNASGRQISALSRTETSLILSCFLFPRLLGGEGAVLCSSYSLGSALSIERIAFKRLPVDYTTSR